MDTGLGAYYKSQRKNFLNVVLLLLDQRPWVNLLTHKDNTLIFKNSIGLSTV